MLTQNQPGRISALAVVIGLLVACESTPQINAVTAPSANLSSYKTYGFVAQPGTNRGGNTTPLTTYFETSIARQMDARGYHKVDTNPDLLVNFNANVQEKADVESMPGPLQRRHRQHRRGRCQQAPSGVGRQGRGRADGRGDERSAGRRRQDRHTDVCAVPWTRGG